MDTETFYDELKEMNKSLRVTIPYRMAEAHGWKKGTKLKVMVRETE